MKGAGSHTGPVLVTPSFFGQSGAVPMHNQNDPVPHEGTIPFIRAVIAGIVEAKAGSGTGDRNEPVEITLGELFDALQARAFGILILVLALPCCVPFVYVIPQVVALPMLLLAGQMAAGRHSPWLPERLRQRSFPVTALEDVVSRAERYVGWFERLSYQRLSGLTGPFGSRLVGLLLLIPCASILVPLPLTNTLPGIGVAIAAVGLTERDGLLVIGGLTIGLIWVALLVTGGLTLIKAIAGLAG